MALPEPNVSDAGMAGLLAACKASGEQKIDSRLMPEDIEYVTKLVSGIHAGNKSIVIVDNGEKIKWFCGNISRAEASSLLGKVIEANGRRMIEGS